MKITYGLIIILSNVICSLHSMQHNGYWTDPSFSMEELQENDPDGGIKLACEVAAVNCGLTLDKCECRFLHHYEPFGDSSVGFMDVQLREKATHKMLCNFQFNRQTKEIKVIHY